MNLFIQVEKSEAEKMIEAQIEALELEMKSISSQFDVFTLENSCYLITECQNQGSSFRTLKRLPIFTGQDSTNSQRN